MDSPSNLEPGIIEKAKALAADLRTLSALLRSDGCDDRAFLVEDAYASAQQIVRQMKKPAGLFEHDPPYRI